ncbi:flavodoxin domain-containing protein [Candidatus Gottesmanbacteria bacterium]|nr:flavodoxin domain-containing protein [Candidatus Gottesmanbacteria bacterium]
MKCLLVYGTLSGSTMTAAELAAAELRTAGHEVDVIGVEEASREKLASYGALIVASPSWEDQGKDGQPLPEVRKFLETVTSEDLKDKKVALMGLGDTSYPHYCGAIDIMEEMLKKISVTPIVTSLRVDRYYSLRENEDNVKTWAAGLGKSLAS